MSSASTRTQTKESGVFVRSTEGSQSLARGLQLLRTFLGGAPNLTNAELAERSGLPRPTVSRLTRSLVDAGLLEFDPAQSVYRLAPVCLSLAAGYQHGHAAFPAVMQLLRERAQDEKVNISLSVRDGDHVVYLASFREGRGPIKRVVSTGFRARLDSLASGHALIAVQSPVVQDRLFGQLAQALGDGWPAQRRRIAQSIAHHRRNGYCTLDSVPGLVALATALQAPDGTWCAVALTTQEQETVGPNARNLPHVLMTLANDMRRAWEHG